ncbi:hypothetical protein PSU4_54780 [Pseudonocardia sulfidoxydans NBRC 16205]|uniref:Uncharacterized protein n=1 Tax=Pseudonocardia sulfidoxydans NBRC 16205 TaxID=1223511 RepID=A0A511DRZ8_9PSEU|nr:hypothetical protein [Pseudonocardia sulfidoxydans]GEL26524.1 hypothetical protein PSU4_54780 [Pseudonocardia sulfidoxydans NBRC 16205]
MIYQALLQLEDVELLDGITDVDGYHRLAPRHTPHHDHDLLIDPETGHYAGEHHIVTSDAAPIPAGTIAKTESVVTAVVDNPGHVPAEIQARQGGTPS